MTDKQVAPASHLKIVGNVEKPPKKVSCPICSAESVMPRSPFCSRRCAQASLGKWLWGIMPFRLARQPMTAISMRSWNRLIKIRPSAEMAEVKRLDIT